MKSLGTVAIFVMMFVSLLGEETLDVIIACYHNGREGISYDDIIEHIVERSK